MPTHIYNLEASSGVCFYEQYILLIESSVLKHTLVCVLSGIVWYMHVIRKQGYANL